MHFATRAALPSLLFSLLLVGCSAERRSEDEAAAPTLPSDLVLMPVADARESQFEDVELSRYVRDAAVRVLKRKGYTALPRDEMEKEGLAAPRNPQDMAAHELAALAPPGVDNLLFLAVTEVRRGYDFGGEQYDVTLSGVVVDARMKTILWRDTGSGRTSLGGFLRIFAPSSPAYDAIYEALQNLFRDVPKRKA
jgi:hypothetical protein